MPAVMWERVTKSKWLTPKVLAIISILSLLVFVFSASRALAATTYHVKVGGQIMGSPLAKGGMVWFNGYDPESIVIHPGDTVTWDAVGGVHTVTSTALATNGSFLFDSSPLFTPERALADMGPGKLLAPGSVRIHHPQVSRPGRIGRVQDVTVGRPRQIVVAPASRRDLYRVCEIAGIEDIDIR